MRSVGVRAARSGGSGMIDQVGGRQHAGQHVLAFEAARGVHDDGVEVAGLAELAEDPRVVLGRELKRQAVTGGVGDLVGAALRVDVDHQGAAGAVGGGGGQAEGQRGLPDAAFLARQGDDPGFGEPGLRAGRRGRLGGHATPSCASRASISARWLTATSITAARTSCRGRRVV